MNQPMIVSYPEPDAARAIIFVDGIRVQINFTENPVSGTMSTIEKMLLNSSVKRDIHAENQ